MGCLRNVKVSFEKSALSQKNFKFNATKMTFVSSMTKTPLMRHFILLLTGFICFQASGQIRARIIDAGTGDPIPYANIQCNNQGLISNEEGYFSLSEANSGDNTPVVVSYIGYAAIQTTPGIIKANDNTVKLTPAMFELDEVKTRTPPSPESIIATVRKNLKQNYYPAEKPFENKIFMRQSGSFAPKTLDVEIDKSTGFSKSALKQVNSDLAKFTSGVIKFPPKEYTDVLFKYYGVPEKKTYKLEVSKATKLKDEKRSASLEGMEKNATALFLKHLDTTKYYRIKSGWFGSRDTVSLRRDFNNKKRKQPKTELTDLKNSYYGVLNENNILSQDFEFIHKPDYYEYKNEGSVLLPDGNFAYVVSFRPDRGRAKYVGKLFVSEGDFAVIRADYKLAEGKKAEGLNLKLLLGVKYSQNLKSGTMIYKQRPGGDGYYLQYMSAEEGQYFYVNRPLKFIELSDAEKDVVAFDFKVEGNVYNKTEYLNLGRNEISDSDFEAAKEHDFKYTAIKQYDPAIWAADGAIEPLEEMKRFKVADEVPQ